MHYYIKPKSLYDSFGDVQPSQPYSYTYGDRPVFEFCFLPNEIAEGDTLVFAVDNDMVFYDHAPENLLHSTSCMVVVRHYVTAEEATAGKVQMRIETRTLKFRDVVNGKVRPVEVISGLYRRRGNGDDINYVLLAKGRAFANGIIADYDALPEPITTDEYYTKGDIDGLLGEKADAATLVAHTDNADIHVTLQDKTTWDSKADVTDIGNATVTITQGGVSRGSFSVNASENVTIDLGGGVQADWNETDTTSPSYIHNKPSVYTKTETDGLLDAKADKATTYTKTDTDGLLDAKADKTSVYTKTETDGLLDAKADKASVYTKSETDAKLDAKANVATTLSGYGIQDAYTKTETDGLLNEKANVATTYTKTETDAMLDVKADKTSTYTKTETDAMLDVKADKTSTYTKTETDGLLDAKADKATTLAGYGIADAYTKGEVDAKVTSVYRYKGTVSTYADLPSSGQEVGDVWNIETADSAHGIKAGDNVAWNGTTWDALAGEIDLTAYPTKSELSTVATTGDYNDLTNRPDLTTKLDAPAVAGTVGQVLTKTADGQEWADAPAGGGGGTDGNPDYLSFQFNDNNKTITFSKNGNPTDVSLEYSFDKITWTPVIVDGSISVPIANTKCYFRGNNNTFSTSESDFYYFKTTGFPYIFGNIMSLLDKSCERKTVPNYCFANLFNKTYTVKGIQSFQATLPATELGYGCYYRMFYNQSSNAAFDTVVLPALILKDGCYKQMFYGCHGLSKVVLYGFLTYRGSVDEMFRYCAYLSTLICPNSCPNSYYTYGWLENTGTSTSPSLYCLNAENISSRNGSTVPANWEVYSLNGTQGISTEVASSSETYTIKYGKTLDTPVITVASALTLNADTVVSGKIAYAEIVLDVASGATVTAGTNLTLVDTPTAGKRNICVARWSNGVAKLYVTIVEDLPA